MRFSLLISLLMFFPMAASARGVNLDQYFPQNVYVDLQKTNDIEVFPQQVIWHGYPQCHYVEIGPKGNLLILSGFKTGDVYFANAHNGHKLATVKIGKVVQGVNISPNGKVAVAVDTSGNALDVISTKNFRIMHVIPVGKTPHNVVFSRSGDLAYVSIQGADKIAVVDMDKQKVLRDIDLKGLHGGPHNLALMPNGQELWVRNHPKPHQDGTVAVINLKTNKVLRYIRVGRFHGGMDVLADGKLAFTTDIGGNTVDAINTETRKIVRRINVGPGPHGVRSSDSGRYVYASTTRGNQLVVIDSHDLRVVKRIPLDGKFGFWLAVKGRP